MNTGRRIGRLAGLLVALLVPSAPARSDEIPKISVVQLERPVWLLGLADPRWLIEFRDGANGAKVSIVPFANAAHADGRPQEQKEDEAGRATRSLALFLSERVFVETTCRSVTEVPVVPGVGPVVSGTKYPPETLLAISRQTAPAVIVSGVVERGYAGARSRVTIEVWEAGSGKLEATFEDVRYFDEPDASALALTGRVIDHLVGSSRCERSSSPPGWERPREGLLGAYLDALSQLLTQSLAENEMIPASTIWGEADMLAWYTTLRQDMPTSVPAQLMYVRGILMSKKYGGSAYTTYEPALVRETSASKTGVLARLAPLIFGKLGRIDRCEASKNVLGKGADEPYAAWLDRVPCR